MAAVVRGPRVLGMNVGERPLFSLQAHPPAKFRAAPKGPLKSPHGLDCLRERLRVRHGHSQNEHREGLVQKPGPKRDHENKRHNADPSLHGDESSHRKGAPLCPASCRDARRVKGLRQSKRQKHIGGHPVLELNQQNIVEEISPKRREKSQLIERRPKIPIDQRPCVEGAPSTQARDESAKPDLQQHEQDRAARKPFEPRQDWCRDLGSRAV